MLIKGRNILIDMLKYMDFVIILLFNGAFDSLTILFYYIAFFQAHQVNDIIVLGPLSCVVSFLTFVVTFSQE